MTMTLTDAARPEWIVLVGLLVGAAISLGRLLAARLRPAQQVDNYFTSREADVAHLLMNLGMAAMLTPWYGQGVRVVLIGLFSAMAATFTALLTMSLVRPGVHARGQRPSLTYHLLASAAMIYATTLNDPMHMGMTTTAAPAPAWILAVVFGLDAVATAVVVLFFPDAAINLALTQGTEVPAHEQAAVAATQAGAAEQPAKSSTRDSRRLPANRNASATPRNPLRRGRRMVLRVAAIPHLVMDVGMILMLVPVW